MNISLSLFKTKGLTSEEVDSIKQSLEDKVKNLETDVKKAKSDMDFWKNHLKKRTQMKKCARCKELIDVWPFNTTVGYYIKGGRVTHVTCPVKEKTK